MKKLMMAAAIVCAAVGVQAATFEWSSSENLTIEDETLGAGLAANQTYDALGYNIDDNGWSLGYKLILSYGGNSETLTGTVETDLMGGVAMNLASSLVEQQATSYKVDYTLTYTATVTDGKSVEWVLTSDTISGQMEVASKGNISLYTDAVSSWSTPAPEPTSGLMLLLGMGVLALRRRRA